MKKYIGLSLIPLFLFVTSCGEDKPKKTKTINVKADSVVVTIAGQQESERDDVRTSNEAIILTKAYAERTFFSQIFC